AFVPATVWWMGSAIDGGSYLNVCLARRSTCPGEWGGIRPCERRPGPHGAHAEPAGEGEGGPDQGVGDVVLSEVDDGEPHRRGVEDRHEAEPAREREA